MRKNQFIGGKHDKKLFNEPEIGVFGLQHRQADERHHGGPDCLRGGAAPCAGVRRIFRRYGSCGSCYGNHAGIIRRGMLSRVHIGCDGISMRIPRHIWKEGDYLSLFEPSEYHSRQLSFLCHTVSFSVMVPLQK